MHALFGSGTTQVNELERYIKDDILRNGSRLADLEKKLINAYEEVVCTCPSLVGIRLNGAFRRAMRLGTMKHSSVLRMKTMRKANSSCTFELHASACRA